MQKHHKRDPKTTADAPTRPGRVRQIQRHFLEHSDFGLAHRLQEEEFAAHYGRNRTQRRESGLGVQAARVVEEEEKSTFITKQFDFYQRKQQIEESDVALARRLQEESNTKSEATDQGNADIYRRHSSNDQTYFKIADRPLRSTHDTSNDEQLARILQEEEENFLFAASKRSSKLM